MYWNDMESGQADGSLRRNMDRAARVAPENAPEKVLGEVALVLVGALSFALAVQLASNLLGFG